jgi:hypothetical protein
MKLLCFFVPFPALEEQLEKGFGKRVSKTHVWSQLIRASGKKWLHEYISGKVERSVLLT